MSVKEAVLPFGRFPGTDTLLGPEMRSTGEVMGVGATFGIAFAKSQIAAGTRLPDSGTVFMSLADRDKAAGLEMRAFVSAISGFEIAATSGTAAYLGSNGVPVATVAAKVGEPGSSNAAELDSGWCGAAGREHSAGPRTAGRRGVHPHRGSASPGAVPDDRRSSTGGRCRHRRVARPPAVGAQPARGARRAAVHWLGRRTLEEARRAAST